MKIALIDPVGGHGGMDFYDYGLSQGLGENNIKVYYFTSTQTSVRTYRNVTTQLIFEKVWTSKNKLKRLYYFLLGYYKSFHSAHERGISIIHLQFFELSLFNLFVVGIASFFPFKKILTLHDITSFKNKNSRFIEDLILRRFNKIIVHNDISFDELSRKVKNKEKIHVIPHGNYLNFVEKLPYQIKSDEKLKLLFFGQIKKVKGLEILLQAMSKVILKNKNVHLTIAGKPWHEDLEMYKALISSLKLNSHVTTHFEYVPNENVAKFFKETDVVVLPYKRIYQSGVLLLTMSYGRVVIASDLPAFKEVIDRGKNGYLFESENPESLAKEILKISTQKEDLLKVEQNASYKIEADFSWNNIGARTKFVYQSV